MVSYPFTPPPPEPPLNCLAPVMHARQPSATWLTDYYGEIPAQQGPAQQVGLGSFWPIPPPGMTLEYRGWSTIVNPVDQTVKVPGDKIYHIHSIALAFDATGVAVFNRTFVVRVFEDADNDDFETVRLGNTAAVPQGTSSQYVFAQGAVAGGTDPLWGVGVLPTPFFIPPGYTVIAGYPVTATGDDIFESRWLIESWDLVPISSSGSGGVSPSPGGGSSGPAGGPYFAIQ